jgi:hypothetical protein
MSKAWSRIIELLCQLLDLLIDATFLFLWGVVNWLLLRGLHYLHPSAVVVTVLWLVQGLFAAFTLAIIGLHIVRDLKRSHHPDAGLKAVGEKLSDMADQLFAITINSTLLGGWAGINSGLHLGLDLLRGESLNLIIISEWIGQFFVAIATLWKVVKRMYQDLINIYHRLFP